MLGEACLPRNPRCCQTQFGKTKRARAIRAGGLGPPGEHSPFCDQVPALVGHAAASSPSLWVGCGWGTWHREAGGPQRPSVEYRVGTAEPSPGSERPSLPLQPSPLHLGRWVLRAGLVARQTLVLGTSLLHPALLGRPSLGTLTTEPASVAAPSPASHCAPPRRQGLALSCLSWSQQPG